MSSNDIKQHRNFMKDHARLKMDFSQTDQNQGMAPPPIQKPIKEGQSMIALPGPNDWNLDLKTTVVDAIKNRQSRRRYQDQAMTLDELAFLLWATQGVKRVFKTGSAWRTVPSAGCRHAFETYLAISNVEPLKPGTYRYLPIDHSLVLEQSQDGLANLLTDGTLGQSFVGLAPVTFIWAAIPYRMEWRYDMTAHRVMLIDVGHICQNLYLACQAIECGTCAIAAYDQDKMDQLIQVDGQDEYTVYLAPVGKM